MYGAMSIADEVEERMRRKEMDRANQAATSSRGDYCRSVVSYKKSLSDVYMGGNVIKRTDRKFEVSDDVGRPSTFRRSRPARRRSRSRSPSPQAQRLTMEQIKAKQAVFAKYGDASAGSRNVK